MRAKLWQDLGVRGTPRSAAALVDQEERIAAHVDAVWSSMANHLDPYVDGSSFATWPWRTGMYIWPGATATNGYLEVAAMTAPHDLLVGSITMGTQGQGGSGATLVKMALLSVDTSTGDMTLVAETANDTTIFDTANTRYTRAFTTAYQVRKGDRIAAGAIGVGWSTPPYLEFVKHDGYGFTFAPRVGYYNTAGTMTDADDMDAVDLTTTSLYPYFILGE